MKALLWFLQLTPIIAAPWIDLEPRQSGTYAITGIQNAAADDGSVPFRLEIRQLRSNADQWNLYLLALDRLQTVPDQNDPLSHYSISGIHGEPYVSWDGVQATAGNENSGYCTHNSVLFPTWHRPYLALYEQVLYSTMQEVVNDFPVGPDRDRYASVASDFRIPYWDWAAAPPEGQSVLPDAVTAPTVTVNGPNGTATIDNPLFSYKFHPNSNDLDSEFSIWQATLRWPTSSNAPNALSQNNLVANGLDQVRGNLQDRLYNLFTLYSNYTTFSNTAFTPATPSSDSDSLEAIHDDIHVAIGGDTGGHMGVINVAAFDPIFYLHHTAVDRAFAIWQALYPESYVEPETSDFETFTISPGDIEDVNSGLTPFHTDTTGDLWTSVSARSTGTFGYSYPELPFWTEDSDPSAYQASLRSKINELYGPPANTTPLANTPHTKRALTTNSNQYREWIANIRAQRFAMTGSFFVRVFLGDFNPDPAQWSFDPNLVGTHGFFGGICKDCQNQDSALVSGAVPLTTALLASIRSGYLASLEPDDVEPYLRTNMHWRVSVIDGTTAPADQVPGLVVSVASAIVTKASSNTEFPKWGAFSVHTSITDSRPGGLPAGGYS